MIPTRIATVALAVVLLGAALGATGVAADADSNARSGDTEPAKEVRIVDEDVVISDAVVTISDTTLRGPGLGEHHVDDREYTLDSTVNVMRLHVTHDDTRYTICRVTVHVEDVGFRLQNVTLTEGGQESHGCDC